MEYQYDPDMEGTTSQHAPEGWVPGCLRLSARVLVEHWHCALWGWMPCSSTLPHTRLLMPRARAAVYQRSLCKALGRTLEEGRFTFVLMDAPNIKLDEFRDVLAAAQVGCRPPRLSVVATAVRLVPASLCKAHGATRQGCCCLPACLPLLLPWGCATHAEKRLRAVRAAAPGDRPGAVCAAQRAWPHPGAAA